MELNSRSTFSLTTTGHNRLKAMTKEFGLNQFEMLSIILEHFEVSSTIQERAR